MPSSQLSLAIARPCSVGARLPGLRMPGVLQVQPEQAAGERR